MVSVGLAQEVTFKQRLREVEAAWTVSGGWVGTVCQARTQCFRCPGRERLGIAGRRVFGWGRDHLEPSKSLQGLQVKVRSLRAQSHAQTLGVL